MPTDKDIIGPSFKPGMRVEMTADAIGNYLHRPRNVRTGIVTSVNLLTGHISVRRDGYKTSESYHPSYWFPLS